MFIEKKIEKDRFNPENVKTVRNLYDISKDEKIALKEIKNWDKNIVSEQDGGSRFVILYNKDYVKKIEYQINTSSFLVNRV